jgi:hypothetical protein
MTHVRLAVLALVLGTAATALALEPPLADAGAAAPVEAAAAPTAAPAPAPATIPPPAAGDAPYESPQRDACEAELGKDARWNAELEAGMIKKFHEREARQVTANNKHVAMAYGALWILMAGFVAMMFFRQRALSAEIERLEAEVKQAAK